MISFRQSLSKASTGDWRPAVHWLTFLLLLITLLAWPGAGPGAGDAGADDKAEKYRPGQVWSYQARQQDQGSDLIVVAVDQDPTLGTIVHVQVRGVSLAEPGGTARRTTNIGHMPFAAEALDRSVVEHLGDAPLPNFQEGYDLWRAAFDDGKAGVYSITVAEAVETIEQALRQ